ncbi:hypothetical protein A2U01_0032764, partial [Trifolium medium]|nr:hypothetical protein [Trifolium medium]
MPEKCLGKSLRCDDKSVSGKGSPGKGSTQSDVVEGRSKVAKSSSQQLSGEALAEFRQSVKKVELPMFDGEDPAGWISRAEVYFRVQDTSPEVKVSLAQLCMEGPTIHFFNSLLDEGGGITWEYLKGELLERYGGHGEGDVYEQLMTLKQR